MTRWNRANNGRAVTIYGNKGRMPHYRGSEEVNGGVPQQGDLATHLAYYKRDLAALIPEADYEGYCLLDYEYWRADWNSSSAVYKTKSLDLAGGDVTLARKRAANQKLGAGDVFDFLSLSYVQTSKLNLIGRRS